MAPLSLGHPPPSAGLLRPRADLASICNDITFATFFVEGRNEQSLIGASYVNLTSFYHGQA